MAQAQQQALREIYSAIPPLRVMDNRTMSKSREPNWLVTADQLGNWKNFHNEVMATTRPRLPNIHSIQVLPVPAQENVKVSSEKGVVSRFEARVCHVVNDALEAVQVPRIFAEMPMGSGAVKCTGQKTPDFSIQNNQEHVRMVGEAKTPWTTLLYQVKDGSQKHDDTRIVLGKASNSNPSECSANIPQARSSVTLMTARSSTGG